jgi:hypothetical protein
MTSLWAAFESTLMSFDLA